MRLPAAILIAACALAAGCTSLASRTRDRDRDHDRDRDRRPPIDRRDPDRPWWLDGEASAGPKGKSPVAGRTDRESIIAGEIVDAREGRRIRGKTFIIVRPAEEAAPAAGRGNVGVETDDDGYFFMPGLVPGKTYLLSVVREIDGRRIAGEMQVKPPAGNIRLELGENKVSSVTPPLPPPPGMGPFEPKGVDPATLRPPQPAADRGWDTGPAPAPIEAPPMRRENIAGSDPMLPPMAAIRPPPDAAPASPPPAPPTPPTPPEPEPPSARGTGQRMPNFIVSDVLGNDWEFRFAAGRLVLVEFWSTTCQPCARAVPALKRLQSDYGASGLEIVAVACEPDGPFAARARDVEEVARRKELNYRVYLEREGKVGHVQRLFGVQWVPTLVLLDRQGTVLWRGGATETDLARAEEIIKSHLTRR